MQGHGARTRLVAGGTALVLWSAAFTGAAAPAQAGLLGDLLGTVTGAVDSTTSLVTGTVDSLLGRRVDVIAVSTVASAVDALVARGGAGPRSS